MRTGEDLFYWREGKYAVDFILKKGHRLWGIEVKSGRKKSLTGLDVFKRKFPDAQVVVITIDNYQTFERDPIHFLEAQ